MYTSLLTLLGFTAAVLAAAVNRDAPLVADRSTPECHMLIQDNYKFFTVSNFQYNASYLFSTPSHQISSGQVSFDLSTSVLVGSDPIKCSAYSTWLNDFFYGNIAYNCTLPDKSLIQTAVFNFSSPARQLAIKETFVCPEAPDAHTFCGSANLTLACTESSYQNPDWKIGEIYSLNTKDCTSPSFSISV